MSDSGKTPRFSLVLATVDRADTLDRFLASLADQGRDDVQLIVVDQNGDDRLVPILSKYAGRFELLHCRCERGLSRARNVGMAKATGDIVAFPDDDCWYPPGLLGKVDGILAGNAPDGVSVTVIDESGRRAVVRWDSGAGTLTPVNLWRRACSISLFLRRDIVSRTGAFDEQLGAGTPWGAGEESDYLLRAIAVGGRIEYRPDISVGHPNPTVQYDDATIARACSYGRGMGKVLARHPLPLWFKAHMCLRPLMGAAVSLAMLKPAKAKFHYAVFRGRLSGWLGRAR